MVDLQKKLNVLTKIANEFNKENLLWAVGASLLLYFNGKAEFFNDIDIMLDEKDVEKCKTILLKMGTISPANPNAQYKTRHFMEFNVDGVDIDVMAGFVIVENGIEHDCSLKEEQIEKYVTVNGTTIPLQKKSLWKQYYQWMGRTSKVEMLDR